jgi:hypothetical protein
VTTKFPNETLLSAVKRGSDFAEYRLFVAAPLQRSSPDARAARVHPPYIFRAIHDCRISSRCGSVLVGMPRSPSKRKSSNCTTTPRAGRAKECVKDSPQYTSHQYGAVHILKRAQRSRNIL